MSKKKKLKGWWSNPLAFYAASVTKTDKKSYQGSSLCDCAFEAVETAVSCKISQSTESSLGCLIQGLYHLQSRGLPGCAKRLFDLLAVAESTVLGWSRTTRRTFSEMIDIIVKRDGTEEPFNAVKVNGWGEWAAKSLKGRVDWPGVVMRAVSTQPAKATSSDLQYALIKECLNRNSWPYNRMAGRLYAAIMYKEIFPKGIPTIKEVHESLQAAGFMVKLDYTDAEYAEIETFIKHKRDFTYAHFQHYHIRFKYALRNRLTGAELETSQFVFMRMAMALAEDQPRERRLIDVKKFYDHFAKNRINAPTPNYVNLGTSLNGYASCCLYTTKDDAHSLAVGDHIGYMMTVQSAGIGNHIQIRSKGDPIRGGLIIHEGKLPYYRALNGAVGANKQNGRAGAANTFFSGFDPEIETLQVLKNPMTPVEKQIRGMDYTMIANKLLSRKAALEEDIFLFNPFTAPDLYKAMFSDDNELFEKLYAQYEANPLFPKTYVPARKIVLNNRNEAFETGRSYLMFADEVNRHTPSKDPIVSSNLCVEIAEPTEGYDNMQDLYSSQSVGYIEFLDQNGYAKHYEAPRSILLLNKRKYKYIAAQDLQVGDTFEDMLGQIVTVKEITAVKREPEVALCSLAGIVVSNIHSEEEYEDAMYYALLMIDKCIHKSDYVLPHVGFTAKNRMSAGVGIMDLAHYMARKNLFYSSPEGKKEIDRVAERHSYYAIKASLRLGRELGNAPWMHRTKWPEGWLPIDTYNRNVDEIVPFELRYDWEDLRRQIIANKGIRNSFLVAYMPGESSSKASGTCNSLYPIRSLTLMKTDNDITTYWAAPDGDLLKDWYEIAWKTPARDMIEVYGVFQKWTDQSISADLYRHIHGAEKVTTDEMLGDYFRMVEVGMKTQYYMNVKSAKAVVLTKSDAAAVAQQEMEEALRKAATPEVPAVTDAAFLAAALPEGEVVFVDVENTDGAEAGCASGACSL